MTPIRVLVICTGNSALSVMAEALIRRYGGSDFEVHSAGTEPKGINPLTERVLDESGIDHSWARSKSVNEFLGQHFDYVITVCDNANESCPVFPADTERIHWSFPDPAAVEGSETERLAAFRRIRDSVAETLRDFIDRIGPAPVAQDKSGRDRL